MQLKCVDTPELLETVAQWLADKQNHQWLDFGNGVQAPSALSLKLMTQRGVNVLRVYTAMSTDTLYKAANCSTRSGMPAR